MAILQNLTRNLDWTLNSLRFIKKHLLLLIILGLVAAFGRAAQLRAFGPIDLWLHNVLEVVIQSARIMIFLFSLGWNNVRKGLIRFIKIFSPKTANWKVAWHTLKTQWLAVILNLVAFSLIALVFNVLINQLAYETCFYTNLRANGILSEETSEWSVILFFKNISVIPFTLVFNATLLLWFVNRLPRQVRHS